MNIMLLLNINVHNETTKMSVQDAMHDNKYKIHT